MTALCIIETAKCSTMDVMTRSSATMPAGSRSHSSKGEMLTEDLNIVDVNLSVQYRIADSKSFVLNVRNPERSLAQATDSALRHVVGSTEMHEVLTEGRAKIAIDVEGRLRADVAHQEVGPGRALGL